MAEMDEFATLSLDRLPHDYESYVSSLLPYLPRSAEDNRVIRTTQKNDLHGYICLMRAKFVGFIQPCNFGMQCNFRALDTGDFTYIPSTRRACGVARFKQVRIYKGWTLDDSDCTNVDHLDVVIGCCDSNYLHRHLPAVFDHAVEYLVLIRSQYYDYMAEKTHRVPKGILDTMRQWDPKQRLQKFFMEGWIDYQLMPSDSQSLVRLVERAIVRTFLLPKYYNQELGSPYDAARDLVTIFSNDMSPDDKCNAERIHRIAKKATLLSADTLSNCLRTARILPHHRNSSSPQVDLANILMKCGWGFYLAEEWQCCNLQLVAVDRWGVGVWHRIFAMFDLFLRLSNKTAALSLDPFVCMDVNTFVRPFSTTHFHRYLAHVQRSVQLMLVFCAVPLVFVSRINAEMVRKHLTSGHFKEVAGFELVARELLIDMLVEIERHASKFQYFKSHRLLNDVADTVSKHLNVKTDGRFIRLRWLLTEGLCCSRCISAQTPCLDPSLTIQRSTEPDANQLVDGDQVANEVPLEVKFQYELLEHDPSFSDMFRCVSERLRSSDPLRMLVAPTKQLCNLAHLALYPQKVHCIEELQNEAVELMDEKTMFEAMLLFGWHWVTGRCPIGMLDACRICPRTKNGDGFVHDQDHVCDVLCSSCRKSMLEDIVRLSHTLS